MANGKFSVEAIFKAVDNITVPLNKMQSRVLGFSKSTRAGLASIGSANATIHSGLMRIVQGAALAGTAVGAIAYNIGKAGMGFEQQMADLGAVSLKSRDQIADLEKKARELGATTKFTATEVGAGMELMAKAGFENTDILKGIGGVLAAAAAEGGEFAETAGHISNVLKGMAMDTSEAGKVADVLALASVRTNSSISSLGESMANVSSTARQFKIPLEDVVASVALLQDVGLDASTAGSALERMLTKLATPTDDVRASMRALGVTFQDAKGNMLPLGGVLENMVKAMDKTKGNMKQVAFFADLTGSRGQKAAQNLADLFRPDEDGLSKYEKLTTELRHAEGSAEKMAKLRMNTLGGDIETLGGAVDELKIRLFDLNSGPLRGIVQSTTKWVEANKEVILSGIQGFIDDVVKNLPEIVKWVKRIGYTVATFYAFATAVKVAHTAVVAYETAVKLSFAATKAWRLGTLAMNWALGANKAALIASSTQLDLFGSNAVVSAGKLAGMRTALNASALGTQINGVTSLLGKAGLLGAALGVGLAFGSWLNTTFELDTKISGIIEKMTGLDKKLAGRNKPVGQPGDQEFGDGTVKDKNGNIVKYGTDPSRHIANSEKASFIREEEGFKGMRMNAAMRRAFEHRQREVHGTPDAQVVTPQERTVRSLAETSTTTTDQLEITIKDDSGKASVTKPPRGKRLKMKQHGAL